MGRYLSVTGTITAVHNSVNCVSCHYSKIRDCNIPMARILGLLQFYCYYTINLQFEFAFHLIPGQCESAAEARSVEGGLHPSPEPSPDDLSSPNPNQAAPLLQAQQKPPSHAEKEDTQPVSASGTGNMDAEIIETGAAKEGIDAESSLPGTDREERTSEKDSEQHRIQEKDCEDKETADGETADEGLPPSKGSEDESEDESEGQNEASDATINPLETPQDCQDDFIDIPDPTAQVGLTFQSRCE